MRADALLDNLALWGKAQALMAASKKTVADVRAARRQWPVRRHLRLAAGANDDEPALRPLDGLAETWHRRCPSCSSEILEPLGRITAADGVLRITLRCGSCQSDFAFIRK